MIWTTGYDVKSVVQMNNSSNEQSANDQFSSNGSYSSNENPPKRIEKNQ